MFTLKFMLFDDDCEHTEVCVRCPHYEARKTKDGRFEITAYTDFTDTNGVSRWVAPLEAEGPEVLFDVCFVENEDGKTVARYAPKNVV